MTTSGPARVARALPLALSLGGALAACAGGGVEPQEMPMVHRRPDTLLQLVLPSSSEPIPEAFARAEALFDGARASYQAGRFAEAARGFLDAARALRIEGPLADAATGNRRFAYTNAASAFSAAGDIEAGRAALAAAASEDTVCADMLGELAAGLAPL